MDYKTSIRIAEFEFGAGNKQRLQKSQMMVLATWADERGVASVALELIAKRFEKSVDQTRRDLKALEAMGHIAIVKHQGRKKCNDYVLLAGLSQEEKVAKLAEFAPKKVAKNSEKGGISNPKRLQIEAKKVASHSVPSLEEKILEKESKTKNILERSSAGDVVEEVFSEVESTLSQDDFLFFVQAIESTTKTALNDAQAVQAKEIFAEGYRAADVDAVARDCKWMSTPLHFGQLLAKLRGRRLAKVAAAAEWGIEDEALPVSEPVPAGKKVAVDVAWRKAVGTLAASYQCHQLNQLSGSFGDGVLTVRAGALQYLAQRFGEQLKRTYSIFAGVNVLRVEVVA